ncbi:MAG: DeoR/GlpR family DNA-binding transcription regulator [Asticcacaulis sp.]
MTHEVPLARRDIIADRLVNGQPVASVQLAKEFNVSEDAIRRDLRALASAGMCRRVYGGALPINPDSLAMSVRKGLGSDQKVRLARKAASTIEPREFLFLDNGSTNLALVPFIPIGYELTVATNSIEVAAALRDRLDLQLFLLGGVVDPVIGGCVSAVAVESVSQLNIDRCFLGACSVSGTLGVSANEVTDATFKRALLKASHHRIVMATSDKLGGRAPHRVANLADISLVVLENDASRPEIEVLQRAGVPLLFVDHPGA